MNENMSYRRGDMAPSMDIRMLIGPQIRMARAALDWTVADLSKASGLSPSAIMRAESASGVPGMKAPNLFKLQRTFEIAGIVFINENDVAGAGVRLRVL
jgi:transcriptional regulator with XRE-family HTH domain